MPTRFSRLTPQVGRGMHHKHQVIEEPCEAKVSRTVLEPRQGGDSLSLGSGMLANHKLAKAIADMGFFEFRRQLEYKCELHGSKLVVVDRWFASSKTCSNCGTKKETLSLSERVFKCERCGFEIDRDLNAAINLEKAVS